jgi:predicted RNase H-like HicB family nuclease
LTAGTALFTICNSWKRQVQPSMTEATARYHIDLFWSAEDVCWVADVLDLRFCSAFGETPEVATREVQLAIQAWLASAREHGDPIPEPRYRPEIYLAQLRFNNKS